MSSIQGRSTLNGEVDLADDYDRIGLGSSVSDLIPKSIALARGAGAGDFLAQHRYLRAKQVICTAFPLLAGDIVAVCLCGAISLLILKGIGVAPWARLGWASPLILLPVLVAYWAGGLYPGIGMHPVVELTQMIKLNTFVFLGVLLASTIDAGLTRGAAFFAIAWLLSIAIMPCARGAARNWSARRSWWGAPCIVIASGSARRVVEMLQQSPRAGLRPALIADPVDVGENLRLAGVPRVSAKEINGAVRAKGIRHAVVALPELSGSRVADFIDRYASQIPYFTVASDDTGMPTLWQDSRHGAGMAGPQVRNGLMLLGPRMLKRCMDLALGMLALVLCFPVLVVMAIAVKFTAPGPVFYGARRIGRSGRPFIAWKLRTMRVDADQALERYLVENPAARAEWERSFKLARDPRVTPIGAFLRKTSLDEIPQLLNVLTGDMSLVGPRPILPDEVERYGNTLKLYNKMRPGITGLWQVSGRNDVDYEHRLDCVTYYVRNWSPWLDVYLIARTVGVVLRCKGAY